MELASKSLKSDKSASPFDLYSGQSYSGFNAGLFSDAFWRGAEYFFSTQSESNETSVDADGNVTGYTHSTVTTDDSGATCRWTNYYDANWNLTESDYSDSTGYSSCTKYQTITDTDGNITGYTDTTTSADASGATYSWSSHYDADWNLTESDYSDSSGYSSRTQYQATYDADGSLTGYTDITTCTDSSGTSYSWTDSYDADWNLTESDYSDSSGYSSHTECQANIDADGNVIGYNYITTCTDSSGASYSWTDKYDANWNLTESDYSDSTGYSSHTEYQAIYDADGNVTGYTDITTCTDSSGASYGWTDHYDANWNLTESDYSDSTGYSSHTQYQVTYDADGNISGYTDITTCTDSSGASYSWTDCYDANWNLTEWNYSDSSGYSSHTQCQANIDADGNVTGYNYITTCTDSSGTSYSWTDKYDANWNLTESDYSDSSGYSSHTQYLATYDADGNVTGYTYDTTSTDASGASYSWTNHYDANWNLTSWDYSDSSGYSSHTQYLATYDADGNVTGYTYDTTSTDASGATYSWTNHYDANWNLTESDYSDSSGYSSHTQYLATYDADGNVTGYTYDTTSTDASGATYSWTNHYDANWNLTQSDYTDANGDTTVTYYHTDIDNPCDLIAVAVDNEIDLGIKIVIDDCSVVGTVTDDQELAVCVADVQDQSLVTLVGVSDSDSGNLHLAS